MNDAIPLAGHLVLVVDDDFYLADDTRAALEAAGAAVLGPFGRADEALAALRETRPDGAVLDLNLGSGPDFEIARAVRDLSIPLVLVTGYDTAVIPPDLADASCLQKPVSNTRLVTMIAKVMKGDSSVRTIL